MNVSGRIMLEEADIHSLSMEELRKNVGLVFQTPAPFPFSIYKNLTYKLSGGQKQRLCIARALTVEPKVLLLDEPCSALDVKVSAKIEELLKNLKERYTIVIVTHNLAQAKRIADDVAFFQNGRLVETKDAETFWEKPECEETKEFLKG